jgi:biofilm PGA synthesis N-glycosyltransferase PgaC
MQWFLLLLLVPYLYLFLKICRNLFNIKPFLVSDLPSIFVSIIIACRNEEKDLPSLLKDISSQDYSPDLFEVIIIDDNSADMTFRVASEFGGIKNLKVSGNNGAGKKQAIRTGVGLSRGRLIITSDADCRMGRSWIRSVASFYEKNVPDMTICPVSIKGGPGYFHRFQELEFLGLQGVTAGCTAAGNPIMCNGANLAFKKEAFIRHSMNLHDELTSGDDVFLLHSIKKENHGRILWLESEDATVTTATSRTFSSFMRQRVRWISKTGAYTDRFTKIVAIVTLLTISLQISVLITGIINPLFLPVFLAVFLLKSIPDFIILSFTSSRYGKKGLMKWFFISQFVYPFYVIAVLVSYILQLISGVLNSPYRKGTLSS